MRRLAVVVLQYKLYKWGLEEEQYKYGFRFGFGIVQGLGLGFTVGWGLGCRPLHCCWARRAHIILQGYC